MSITVQANAPQTFIGYCVKCKGKVSVSSPERVTLKTGRFALKGKCPHCATSVFKITGKSDA